MKDVTVVMTAHNLVRFTSLALMSLRDIYPDLPVVIVDHASTDETETYLRRHVKLKRQISHIRYEGPRNLSHSWNLGVAQVKTRFAVICNNDIVWTPGAIEELVNGVSHPQVAVALPQDNNISAAALMQDRQISQMAEQLRRMVREYDPSFPRTALEFVGAVRAKWESQRAHLTPEVHINGPYYPPGGFCFAIDLDKHAQIGEFDERHFDYYGEDWDYFARALRHFKIVRRNRALIWHFDKTTSRHSLSEGEVFDALMRSRFKLGELHEGHRELISIVIPVKERARELAAALKSVRDQSVQHWRCYVVNDGSADREGIARVCNSFTDPRIGLWDLPSNQGPSAARNFGIDRCSGKYIALLDSDDEWMPLHLEKHLAVHENADLQMTYSHPRFRWRWWDEPLGRYITSEDEMPGVTHRGEFDRQELERKNFIVTSTTFWWAPTLKALRFDESMRFEEDWDLCKRTPDPIACLPETTVIYQHNPEEPSLLKEHMPTLHNPPERPRIERAISNTKLSFKSPFTVIVPTRDRPELLRRAIASVGGACEVIVVDDHSLKLSEVREVCEEFPNVRLHGSAGRGPSAARNTGVLLASSPWVKFLDDDDMLTPGWIVTHELAIKTNDVISTDAAIASANGMRIVGEDELYTSQLAFRVGGFNQLGGFNEDVWWGEEKELLERACAAGLKRQHLFGVYIVKAGETVRRDTSDRPAVLRQIPVMEAV